MRADNSAGARGRRRSVARADGAARRPRRTQRGARDGVASRGSSRGASMRSKGLMHHGTLHVLAIFDKPDPLDGPFFEETVYVTPSVAPDDTQEAIVVAVTRAAAALGLHHGPIHAECRVATTDSARESDVFVLEVAARPIGGLCARALRFRSAIAEPRFCNLVGGTPASPGARRRSGAVPARTEFFGGDDDSDPPARDFSRRRWNRRRRARFAGSTISTSPPSRISCWCRCPKGRVISGLCSRARRSLLTSTRALREAHARLVFTIEPELPLLTSAQLHYNRPHG